MRFTLPESSHRRQRSPGGTLFSAALHAVAIGATIVATGMSAERPSRRVAPPETLVYVRRQDEVTRVVPPARRQDTPPRIRPMIRPLDPSPPVIAIAPAVVPAALPPIGASLGVPFDSGATVATGGATTATGGTPGDGADAGAPMSAFAVDREVVALRGVTPRYPTQLASAGIEGTVVLHFVVDTSGRVEPASIDVVRADQPLFVPSVREALARSRFVPAEAAGRKVRQLVEQSFTFNLTRR